MKADWAQYGLDSDRKESVPQKQDLELVEAAIAGDADSFTGLCSRYYPAMVAIAHSLLGDRHLAEDAAQQAFAKAARKLPQLKSKERFARWLAVICRNAAADMARSRTELVTDHDLSQVTQKQTDDGPAEAVREAIDRLSPAAKEIVYLRFYDGMPYQQISAVLGSSHEAINGRLRRAKKKIAEHLRRNGFAEVRL